MVGGTWKLIFPPKDKSTTPTSSVLRQTTSSSVASTASTSSATSTTSSTSANRWSSWSPRRLSKQQLPQYTARPGDDERRLSRTADPGAWQARRQDSGGSVVSDPPANR